MENNRGAINVIFISAGHYPSAPGAKYQRFIEHDEAVIWQKLICNILGDKCISVPTGVLRTKADFINERVMNGDIAAEIHFNAATDSRGTNVGRGSETLYYPGSDKGKALAEACQSALEELFPPNRGAKEGYYRMDPARGPDFFLAKTKCPAVIVEPEFVHRFALITEKRVAAVDKLANALLAFEAKD
jgi:hypothetical protein